MNATRTRGHASPAWSLGEPNNVLSTTTYTGKLSKASLPVPTTMDIFCTPLSGVDQVPQEMININIPTRSGVCKTRRSHSKTRWHQARKSRRNTRRATYSLAAQCFPVECPVMLSKKGKHTGRVRLVLDVATPRASTRADIGPSGHQ